MASADHPRKVLRAIAQGTIAPLYLFYGPNAYLQEELLNALKAAVVPEEAARDLNLQVFHPDDKGCGPGKILEAAQSLPFLSERRLVVVRRSEDFTAADLEVFLPYLQRPSPTTCLAFTASAMDARRRFFKQLAQGGHTVQCRKLFDNEVVPWVKGTAQKKGLELGLKAAEYLHQAVGNDMLALANELEKIRLMFGEGGPIPDGALEELVSRSRNAGIFELLDAIGLKRRKKALALLERFLEEEGRDGAGKLPGMLTRHVGQLLQTRAVLDSGGRAPDIARKAKLQDFQVRKLIQQAQLWEADDIVELFGRLHQADGWLKSGGDPRLVLAHLVLVLTG